VPAPSTTWTPRDAPSAGGGQGTLSRDTCGLLFRDQFNRENGAVGNNWSYVTGYAIATNALRYTTDDLTARTCDQTVGIGTDDYIVQQTFKSNYSVSQQNVRVVDATGAFDGIVPKGGFNPAWRFLHRGSIVGSLNEDIADNQWHTVRLVRESSASRVHVLRALNVGSGTAISDVSSIITASYTTAVSGVTLQLSTVLDVIAGAPYVSDRDDVFACRRNVVVTGLPENWQIRVDNRGTATASNGSAVLSVDTWGLPASTLYVLDDTGSTHTFLTPSGTSAGIWGGDVYAFSRSSAVWGNRSDATASWGARSAPSATTWSAV
jgi:hypothetical protein